MKDISQFINQIIQGDCLEVMRDMPDNCIDLVVTSPPYNKGFYDKHTPSRSDVWKQRNINYDGFMDNLEPGEYIMQQISVLWELVRLIKPTGSIFYNTKSVIADHRIVYPIFVFNFNVRQQIIWDRQSSPQLAPIRFYPTTEYIFWITKKNVQPKFYRRGKYDKEVWRIVPGEMLEHPAPFPIDLPAQCILSTTDEGDTVLDPFSGSGTTALACLQMNRNYIGIDISEKYCQIARERIEKEKAQLKLAI